MAGPGLNTDLLDLFSPAPLPTTPPATPAPPQPGRQPTASPHAQPQTQQESQLEQQRHEAAQSKERNAYAQFRELLKHPSSEPVQRRLAHFVHSFPGGLSRDDAASRVHKFLKTTEDWMLKEAAAFAAEADEDGRKNAAEGLEKFLLSRLHPKVFSVDPKDASQDAALSERLDSLSWASFENLAVPPVDVSLLDWAIRELRSVDDYKAPRDKLVCILNAAHVINDVLKWSLQDSGAAGRPLSADDFLPLLIYCVLKADPPRLHSNVEFVAAFRHPSRLNGEGAYFLTALQSAVAFIMSVTPKALEVSCEEFERLCAQSLEEAQERRRRRLAESAANSDEPSGLSGLGDLLTDMVGDETDGVSPSAESAGPVTVEAKAASLPSAVRARLAAQVKELPFTFEAVLSTRHLRVDAVPALLREYRELAALLRSVEGSDFDDDG